MKLKKFDYQDNLQAVKENGSIEKQSKLPSTDPGPIKLKKVRSSGQPFVPGNYVVPNQRDNVGESGYDTSVLNLPNEFYEATVDAQQAIYDSELEEARAQEQTGGEKLLNGLGRAVAKTGTEFGKGLGYLGGGITAIFTQDIDDIVNNAFVNAFDSLDESVKESMPVHVRREVENGSLARQLWSPEFYANEGADAVGFMASSILLGGGLGAVSKGLGASKGLANLGKFLKVTQGGAKAESTANMFINTLGQSYVESFAETDGALKEFDAEWQDMGNGFFQNSQGKVATPEEVAELRGNLGASTFTYNMVVTALPNYFTTKALFGTGGASRNIFDELNIDTSTLKGMKEGLQDATKRSTLIKEVLKGGATGSAAEGFQEASQFAIGEYEGAKSKMMTDDGLIEGLIEGYKNAFTTTEGLKSIFLGGLLGLGPGLVKGFKDRKSRLERATGLSKLMEENMVDLKQTFESYYKKDEDGQLIQKDGEYIIDTERVMNDLEQGEKDMNDEFLLAFAKENGMTHAAKSIMTRKLIEKTLPYFQISGGEEIFNQHFKELTDVVESDGKLMGFSSKEDYVQYLEETVKTAKKEYDNIKNIGPRYFGININEYKQKIGRPEAKKALETFYNQMEAQGALYGALLEMNKKELKGIQEKRRDIEMSFIPADPTTGEAGPEMDAKQQREIEVLKANEKAIKKNISDINANYKKIFDPKEQQKAFNHFVDRELDKQKMQEEYESEKARKSEFAKNFYAEVEKKYGDIQDSFNSNKVRLRDNQGNIHAILKMKGPEGNLDYFVMPVNKIGAAVKSKAVPATEENMAKLGLAPENIMSPKEFDDWRTQQRVVVMNDIRLKRLNELISSYENRRDNTVKGIEEKLDELTSLNEKLDYWKGQTEIPLNEIADEIEKLEGLIEAVQDEIDSLYDYTQLIKDNIVMLDAMRREIQLAIEENREFDFNVKLNAIRETYEKEGFTKDEELLGVSMDIMEEKIEELTVIRDNMQDSLNDLYDYLRANRDFKKILEDLQNSKKGLSDITEFIQATPALRMQYPELFKEPGNPNNTSINFEFLDLLIDDIDIRRNFLRVLKNNIRDNNNMIHENRKLYNEAISNLKEAQKEYQKLKDNKDFNHYSNIIEKNIGYMKTKYNLTKHKKMRQEYVEAGFGQNTAKSTRLEQEGSSSKEITGPGPLKDNEYSTITNVYEDASMTRLNPNPAQLRQASEWSDAMMRVDLNNLDNYSFRIVNNKQLAEMGTISPSDDADDLYAVLLKNGVPYVSSTGTPVFTGIAHVDTYFPEGSSPKIAIERGEDYIAMETSDNKNPITKENPYVYNNISYSSKKAVFDAIVQKRKLDYRNWRDGLVMRTEKGQEIYLGVEHVSRGHAFKYGSEKNNPKKVFDIKSLEIGDKFTKTANGKKISVQNGAVYAETSNGQKHRLLNNTIGSLPETKKQEYLNKIIGFMALAEELGKDYGKQFRFKGSKTGKMALFGNSKKPGILDYFISWNTNNPNWNIHMVTKAKTGEKAFVFHLQGEEKWLNVSDMFDSEGNVRNAGDPMFIELVQYLDTKYMNVVSKNLNKKAMIPKGWQRNALGEVELTYDYAESYNDYVMDNYLYTDIPVPTESDKVPMMVNQYAVFGKELEDKKPVSMEKNRKETVKEAPISNDTVDMSRMFGGTPVSDSVETQKNILQGAMDNSPKVDNDAASLAIQKAMLAGAMFSSAQEEAGYSLADQMEILKGATVSDVSERENKKEEKKEEDCSPASPFDKKPKLGKR